jgi:hypothetical protein|tara:strand:- start:329 stop:568 length:240 start_codon:yes stop_codon:yes gene_type:complete
MNRYDRNYIDLEKLYKKWKSTQNLSANENNYQVLWLDLFNEMWSMNEDIIFYDERNGDDISILSGLITKYIAKEMGDLK